MPQATQPQLNVNRILTKLEKIKIKIAVSQAVLETNRLVNEALNGELRHAAFGASLESLIQSQVDEIVNMLEGTEDF